MDQSIKLQIGGREYPLKATSPEMEQVMRLAAEEINQRIDSYNAKYPDRTMLDKLAFVALNETVAKINCQRRLSAAVNEAGELTRLTNDYLSKLK